MHYRDKEGVVPQPEERICVVSFVIALTRVGGGPKSRTGFWPAYREALETNVRTGYQNARLKLCGRIIDDLYSRYPELETEEAFYRNGSLIQERVPQAVMDTLSRPL